ncbi:MAG TPA: TRAFs-binding domain-containing protein, partial [Pyrinomonadaceae bacterium]|nr:TRAFs-binding domain-containing protein [Pyrinomonadaceae bacterium]
MPWDDAVQLETSMAKLLDEFNWPEADELCDKLIIRIHTDAELIPERTAKNLLQSLRRKRRFACMTQLGEALLQSGLRTPQIRRQYAQALIDQGILAAAEMILQSIVQDPQGIKGEELEARGLIGRIYKQLFVNLNDLRPARKLANIERALQEYYKVYLLDDNYLWHGINVVALSDRARRDGITLAEWPEAAALAQEILGTLKKREEEATDPLPAWDVATELEALVALGQHKDAADAAFRYVAHKNVDAFEIASTLRQLTEVWQLNDNELPGKHVLPILKAGLLKKQGAAITNDPQQIKHEIAAVEEAMDGLESVFSSERMVTLGWYKKGLQQCDSVARVQKLNGQGHGTGWLVNASDFFTDQEGLLLLTNGHVVSDNPNPFSNPKAIYPEDARIKFQTLGDELYEVEELVWTSAPNELDATFLRLKGLPASAQPLAIHTRAIEWTAAAPALRLYI